MSKTRTGGIPIGFRRGGGWQSDLAGLASWAKGAGFCAIDLHKSSAAEIEVLKKAGLMVGSCDLADWSALFSKDEGERKAGVETNKAYVKEMAAAGATKFFLCVMPKDVNLPAKENFEIAAKSFSELAPYVASVGGQIVIEGWPGGWPRYGNLCCNPETYRRMLKEVNSPGLGINFDPSHLVRMGIDPVRFLGEFVQHVGHVHAKDTEIIPERVYEFGLYQLSVFEPCFHCGESVWRYTIPGHGQVRWLKLFQILQENGYKGLVSVELEDHSFCGSEQAEKDGLTCSLKFLTTV